MSVAKVTVEQAAEEASSSRRVRLELVAPFIEAAADVIKKELGETVGKGRIHRVRSPRTSGEVSALVAVTGGLSGIAVYSMSLELARTIASAMIGERVAEFDEMAQSAIAELANVVTGQAGIRLERNGYRTHMSPPALLVGAGSTIATFDLTRLVVPLLLSGGEFNVDIAVKASL